METILHDAVQLKSISATRILAATCGILVGLAGIEHGFFEILQGHTKPESILIDAIGPAQRFWEYGTETALTIVPSFLMSGILSIIVGFLVVIWSVAFLHKKHGWLVLLSFSILLFLVGGGFAPIFLAILGTLVATRIDKPLNWWRVILPAKVRGFLVLFWPWTLILSVLLFVIAVEIAIFGYPLLFFLDADATFDMQYKLALIMMTLMILTVPIAFAYDINRQDGLIAKKA